MNRSAFGMLASTPALLLSALIGTADAAALTVHVQNGLTGAAMANAFVMVGSEEDVPFAGNVGSTNAGGTIIFDDPGLVGPQTVTAGFADFGYTTLYESAVDEITVTLYPRALDEDMGGDHARVEGEVDNISSANNDGFLDISIVLNAV